jgi:hypothetical protein
MYEELSAYIGLIIFEVNEHLEKEFNIADDYMTYELKMVIDTIKFRCRKIQLFLKNPDTYDGEIQDWLNDYEVNEKDVLEHPIGYTSVAKALCKKLEKNNLIDDLIIFLEKLGQFINVNYYYDI